MSESSSFFPTVGPKLFLLRFRAAIRITRLRFSPAEFISLPHHPLRCAGIPGPYRDSPAQRKSHGVHEVIRVRDIDDGAAVGEWTAVAVNGHAAGVKVNLEKRRAVRWVSGDIPRKHANAVRPATGVRITLGCVLRSEVNLGRAEW